MREIKLGPHNIGIIKRLLTGRNSRPLRSLLNRIEPADLASLFGLLNDRETTLFIEALISINRLAEALLCLPESQLKSFLPRFSDDQILYLLGISEESDATYLLTHFSEEQQYEFLLQLDSEKKIKIEQFLNYPEESAGRLMHTQVFALLTSMTAQEGLEELRNRAQQESIYYIYCVDKMIDKLTPGHLEGIISLRQLATAPPSTRLRDIIKRDVVSVTPETPSHEVAKKVAHYNYVALPVVNSKGSLVGLVTVDDVVDIIQEQATADIYAQAGLQEDDRIFTPASQSIKNRIPWMLLNLILAAMASSVVALFEETMSHLIILASLKNIVAGMGGNTAIQSLTVVTRGLATGDFNYTSKVKAIFKELAVGFTIGLITGVGACLLTYLWKGNLMVSIVIFCSMVLNSIVASLAGACIPIILNRYKWDPAVGSGVLVTMMTDIFSFFSFLGIATLGLKYFT